MKKKLSFFIFFSSEETFNIIPCHRAAGKKTKCKNFYMQKMKICNKNMSASLIISKY